MGTQPVWWIACIKPNSLSKATVNLTRQGFRVYAPRYLRSRRLGSAPLFPGYLFIRAEERFRAIDSTAGVSRLLYIAPERPATVHDAIIDDLKARENYSGIIELPATPRFLEGQEVKIVSGSFEGKLALWSEQSDEERCYVLLECFGRMIPVRIEERDLRAVSA